MKLHILEKYITIIKKGFNYNIATIRCYIRKIVNDKQVKSNF